MIQPRSVSQNRTSSRSPPVTTDRQSAWKPTSSAILATNPACTCTTPFGLPVVPLVYATNSGCSASNDGVSKRAARRRARSTRPASGRDRPASARRCRAGRRRPPSRRPAPRRPRRRPCSFIGDDLAAPRRAVGGHERLRRALLEPHRDRVGAVAGEDRQEDRAELGDGHDGGDRLGQHRQEHADRVARADAAGGEAAGDRVGQRAQLAVGDASAAGPSSPSQRIGRVVAARRVVGPPVDARPRPRSVRPPVNHVAHSMPRDSSSTWVYGSVNGMPRKLDERVPEPLGLVDRALPQRLEVGEAVRSHEPADVARGRVVGRRRPGGRSGLGHGRRIPAAPA